MKKIVFVFLSLFLFSNIAFSEDEHDDDDLYFEAFNKCYNTATVHKEKYTYFGLSLSGGIGNIVRVQEIKHGFFLWDWIVSIFKNRRYSVSNVVISPTNSVINKMIFP